MFSNIFTSRHDFVFDSNKSQDLSMYDLSSKTNTSAASASPAKKPKQTKLKGNNLRRKVRAATDKRVFVAPNPAELAAKREMRDRFTAMARRERASCGEGDSSVGELQHLEMVLIDQIKFARDIYTPAEFGWGVQPVDMLMMNDIDFQYAPRMWGPKATDPILVDEIDFEASARWNASRAGKVEAKGDRAARPVKAVLSSLGEGWGDVWWRGSQPLGGEGGRLTSSGSP